MKLNSIYPGHGHPLVLCTKVVEDLGHFAECDVKIFVDDHLVDVFLIRPLQKRALFQSSLQILLLKIFNLFLAHFCIPERIFGL